MQTKEAMLKLDNRFEEELAKLIGQCHDELLILAPGRTYIDYNRCEIKDGVFTKIVFGYDEEAEHWARITKEIMEGVQNEMFDRMQSPIRGMASYADAIAPVWAH